MGGCSIPVSERHPTTNCRTPEVTGVTPLIKNRKGLYVRVSGRPLCRNITQLHNGYAPNLVSILDN